MRVINRADGVTEILLFDEIGMWGLTAKDFANELKEVDANEIALRINSAGGDVYDGIAMMNTLRSHPARVTAFVEGLAASAASFLAVGGADEVVMCPHSEMMIHDAMTFITGNAAEAAEAIKQLERVSDNIASIYADKSGGDPGSFREAMRAETWFTAEEAVLAGLADRVGELREASESMELAAMSNSRFQLVNKFRGRRGDPPADLMNKGETNMADSELLSKLFKHKDAILALAEALEDGKGVELAGDGVAAPEVGPDGAQEAEQPGPGEPQPEPGEAAEESGESDDGKAENESPGTVTLDAETYEQLKTAAEAGWAAAEEQSKRNRAAEVDQWIADGRISSGLRDKAIAAIEANADAARATFGANPKNTIPRAPLGHSVDDEGAAVAASHDLSKSADASGLFGAPSF